MALTLLEANKFDDGNFKRSAIIEMFAETSDLLRVMPIDDIPGDSYAYTLEAKLPSVGFRGINEGFNESTGVINPQVEVLRIVGGDIDVDRQLVRTRGEGARTTQESMMIKAIALSLTDKIINGDSDTDPREFDGLRKRIGGSQLVEATQTASTNGPLSLFKLDEAIDKVPGANYLIMSLQMRNRLTAAARANVGGDVQFNDIDEFGNRVASYNGIPILIVDTNEEDEKIIAFDEAGPGGGTTSTSIYVVSFGPDRMMGLQNGSIDVRDLGEVDDKPVLRTRIDWVFGFVVQHGRSVARIWGITDAIPVA